MRQRPPLTPVSQWTDPRHVRGIIGEQKALAMLRDAGWTIEAHRFRAGRHDIDLVVRKQDLVVFVEVKTRSSRRYGAGEESIGWRKRRALVWAATVWAARFGQPTDRYRFDVVTVSMQCAGMRHIEDAWRP